MPAKNGRESWGQVRQKKNHQREYRTQAQLSQGSREEMGEGEACLLALLPTYSVLYVTLHHVSVHNKKSETCSGIQLKPPLPTHLVLHVTLQNVLLPRMPPSVHGIGRSPIVLGGSVTLHRSEWKDGTWACHALAYSSTKPWQSTIMLRTAIQSLGCLGLLTVCKTIELLLAGIALTRPCIAADQKKGKRRKGKKCGPIYRPPCWD
jgi:hypothetical protein